MHISLAILIVALLCIRGCIAIWQQIYSEVESMQSVGSGGFTIWYREVSLGEEFTNDISFSSLLEVVEAHWNYVKKQRIAFTVVGS